MRWELFAISTIFLEIERFLCFGRRGRARVTFDMKNGGKLDRNPGLNALVRFFCDEKKKTPALPQRLAITNLSIYWLQQVDAQKRQLAAALCNFEAILAAVCKLQIVMHRSRAESGFQQMKVNGC